METQVGVLWLGTQNLRQHRGRRHGAITREAYPTWEEVYEDMCQQIEVQRRDWKRRATSAELVEAARDLANGSKQPHDRLVAMAREIEESSKDRSDTTFVSGMISVEAGCTMYFHGEKRGLPEAARRDVPGPQSQLVDRL